MSDEKDDVNPADKKSKSTKLITSHQLIVILILSVFTQLFLSLYNTMNS